MLKRGLSEEYETNEFLNKMCKIFHFRSIISLYRNIFPIKNKDFNLTYKYSGTLFEFLVLPIEKLLPIYMLSVTLNAIWRVFQILPSMIKIINI